MIFLIDMDGPIAGFNQHYFARCEARGIELDCTLENQSEKFATSHVVDRGLRAEARGMVEQQGWFRDLPVVPGALEGLGELAEHGEVWICTKPLEANLWCRDEKASWVAEHLGSAWQRKLIIAPDKSLIIGDILLDDGPDPRWYKRAVWSPVIFDLPYNRAGSKWEGDDRWCWGDPIVHLLEIAAPAFHARAFR